MGQITQQCLTFRNRKRPTKRKSMKRAGAGAGNASYGMQPGSLDLPVYPKSTTTTTESVTATMGLET